jgi:hypothetical protein
MIFYLIPGYRLAKTPGRYIPPSYTNTPQVVFVDTTDKLNTTLITELQAIIGTLLHYAKAVDSTLLTIANELTSQQAQPTQRVLKGANRVLSYCSANHHNALIYHACDMALYAFADTSYLCRSHARSVSGAIFFLGNKTIPPESTVQSTYSQR